MAGTVCKYVVRHRFVVTGATGQLRAGPGTPNDLRAAETLTTCARLDYYDSGAGNNASAECESGWYSSSLALAAVTEPTPSSSTGPWPLWEVVPAGRTANKSNRPLTTLQHPYRNMRRPN